ncbi:MAG: hypothetical protein WCK04_02740 [Actinomycetes bacterium]
MKDPALKNLAGLKPGQILLHIGVHKTGTTAIQDAFARNRGLLTTLGVSYPGTGQAHRNLASSVMQRPLGWRTGGAQLPDPELWSDFLDEAKKFEGITVCSSEFFAESTDDVAQRIVDQIGINNVHVVITLRNFGKILPSAWQQILKSGYEFGYVHWLTNVLSGTDLEPKSQVFWTRHRHDEVVTRWAKIVGPKKVTVVVVDDSKRDSIFRDFESLLGIAPKTLSSNQGINLNRSMTLAEAELIRRVNEHVGGGKGWKPYSDEVHDGLIKAMVEGRVPDADEPQLQTPQWALDVAARHAATYVAAIKASEVNVMGDLELLGAHLKGPIEVSDTAVKDIALDAAVAAILGAIGDRTVTTAPPTISTLFKGKASKLRRNLAGK